jgi:O-Antigen ligase
MRAGAPRGRRRVSAAALVVFAALLAAAVGHWLSLSMGAASAKLLVDSGESELLGPAPAGASRAELAGQLAVTYALYLQSDQATAELGGSLGLKGRVAASGPFTLLLGRTNFAPKSPVLADPVQVDNAYRLGLDVDGVNPVLTLYAQAPSAHAAIALVDAARALLARHVLAQESTYPLGPEQAVVLRPLGPTVGGLVDPGARWQLMAAVFLLALALGGGFVDATRHRSARKAAPGTFAQSAAATPRSRTGVEWERGALALGRPRSRAVEPTGGEWPHTTRVLPWALAGFVAMLFLVPFDAIDLPVSLPLNSTPDRLALLGLVALWATSMVVLSATARPRLRLTRVHYAALVFFAVCCLSIALDGPALANMDEVTLVVKKLALLASYIVFFFLVASTLRPREAPRFAVLIVVLGTIVAVATVIEYRLHYNVFYSLWGKLLPISTPSEFDTRDSLGRLTVYGPTSQPLELAALLAMVLPFAVLGSIEAATRRRRLLYSLAIGLLLAGGVATSRKTSLVAPAGAILLLGAYRPRAIARTLVGLALVLVVLVHFTSPGALGSVASQLEPGNVGGVLTTTDRTARYDAVRPDVLRHPLLGRGFQSYDPHKYRILDNEYLGLLITVGLLGVAAYIALFATVMGSAHRLVREPDPQRASLALGALAAVGVVALASALFDVLSFPHVPYLLFFLAATITTLREPAPSGARGVSDSPRRGARGAPRPPASAPRPHVSRSSRFPAERARPTPARSAGA